MRERIVMDLELQVFGHFSAKTIFSEIWKGVTS
ncbi:hypothetical protein M5D96_005033 [Drosophila gunungcola]|uniref:Uncharacterized protein n=1 Tax=Drosophila gunungcola TaxID=103775 RepID=A0A9P9YVK1_9MUSC|nr:hypothetical protein M5D96_005033 [Drosophila gunungcola]